jgi:DNA polymerase I-like protein with 3'-5' exonuclease and polymerase domains
MKCIIEWALKNEYVDIIFGKRDICLRNLRSSNIQFKNADEKNSFKYQVQGNSVDIIKLL